MSDIGVRFRFKLLGGHVHVRVFAGKSGRTYGKAGDLIFTQEEWALLSNALNSTDERVRVEILPEEA